MTYLQNKYTKWYYNIVSAATSRKDKPIGAERHHIIPECFYIDRKRKGPAGWLPGNSNDKSNLVYLTPHEHFVCHLLLTKMVEGKAKSKMHLALLTMARASKTNNRHKISGKIYAKIRANAAANNCGENNGMWGKKRTEEEKANIRAGIAASDYVRPPISQAHKDAISKANKDWSPSQKTRDNWSKVRKGRPGQDNNSGKKWFNNGERSFLSKESPPGCLPGRLPYRT